MTTIPNELKIIINTSIPGYKKIDYKPSMTLPNISSDDNVIRFDPLIKLDQNILNTVPENLRKKEFFNKNIFEEIVRISKSTASKDLTQATRNGYVDNNINIILKNIFSENSVINIGKNPYAISDVQWIKGDWKIDIKENSDDKLNRPIVREDIISGQIQLNTLSSNIIYGNNYSGPITINLNTAAGPTAAPAIPVVAPIVNPAVAPAPALPVVNPVVARPASAIPVVNPVVARPASALPVVPPKPSPKPKPTSSTTKLVPPVINPPISPPAPLPIPPPAPPSIPPPIPSNAPVIQPPLLQLSRNSTDTLRNFFQNEFFFYLINSLFNTSNRNLKFIILSSLKYLNTGNISDDNVFLNKHYYDESVLSLNVNANDGGGDCFFLAVANAINNYNYNNQDNRIISGRYGTGGNLFTQKYLRSLVAAYFLGRPDLEEQLATTAVANSNTLNQLFEQQINALKLVAVMRPDEDFSPEIYVNIATF
jgi:hypothetical protein